MAAEVGAEYHERILSLDDLLAFLPEMVRLQDEPVADPVCFPLYYVSELARREGVTVAQAGEGADELFFGYPSWRTLLRLQRADDLRSARQVARPRRAAVRRPRRRAAVRVPPPRRRRVADLLGRRRSVHGDQKQRLLSPRLRRELAGLTSWDVLAPIRKQFEEAAWEPSHVNWMTYLDLRLRLPELLLMRIDKMSMGVSLEARVPFLDHRFVSLALSIPTHVKVPRRRVEARVAARGAWRDPRRADRPPEAGLPRAGRRVVAPRARRPHADRGGGHVRTTRTCSTRARQRDCSRSRAARRGTS